MDDKINEDKNYPKHMAKFEQITKNHAIDTISKE